MNKIPNFKSGDIVIWKTSGKKVVLVSRWDSHKVKYVAWNAYSFDNPSDEFIVREFECASV